MPSPESMRIMQELESLETLSQGFSTALEEGVKSRDLGSLEALRQELEIKRDALRDKLNPFESTINLKEQYKSQWEILERTGVLKSLSSGERGIVGIDGEDYPMPSYEEIVKRMKENKEVLSTKIEQGFGKLLVVPQGMSLDHLIENYKQTLLTHHTEGKLFATKKYPSDPNIRLDLNTITPIRAQDGYKYADIDKTLVYYPTSFSEHHHGKTKQELIREEGGWSILLVEDMPNIPKEGQKTSIASRPQFEVGKTPNAYLALLTTDPRYQHESGLTPEAWLIYALTHLEETNQFIEDIGITPYNLGGYFPVPSYVPLASWGRDNRQVYLGTCNPNIHQTYMGARSAVKI
ncbi:MAG: hypothetical protein U1A23_02640 [Candidatus Sungbacteria bacterium]|nr:hypothetical protein [Candidatus Sungbacteria bacterium]